jgi:RNA polymerase sigma-70 factor (sigma-E family)
MMAPVSTMPNQRVWGGGDLRDLYRDHRWSLVRLASLLLHDPADAEEVVQDAFVQTQLAWDRLRDPSKAVAYLRRAVVNGARSRLRHRRVVERFTPGLLSPGPSPEAAAVAGDDRRRVIGALRSLPDRQRECLVLRYYLDLTEAEIAATLGISAGSVKTHAHRGLAALAARLEGS